MNPNRTFTAKAAMGLAMLAASCGVISENTAHKSQPPTTPGQQAAVGKADRQMAAVLAAHAKLNPKPIESLPPAEARRQPSPADAVNQVIQERRNAAPERLPPVGRVEMRTVPGPQGVQIPVRVYTPKGTAPFPVIVYYHGGGWVIADLDTYDASCRGLTGLANAVVRDDLSARNVVLRIV